MFTERVFSVKGCPRSAVLLRVHSFHRRDGFSTSTYSVYFKSPDTTGSLQVGMSYNFLKYSDDLKS